MRRKLIGGAFGLVAMSLLVTGSVPAALSQPQDARYGQGLCRRPAALPALPPERPPIVPQQQRMEPPYASTMAPPPPPPPPPPPASAPVAEGGDIVVTGSPASRSRTESAEALSTFDVAEAPPPTAAPPPVASTAAPEPALRSHPRRPYYEPQSGLLTAGDHDDLLNPELYARYVRDFLRGSDVGQYAQVPVVDTQRVLTVAVADDRGRPVPFAPVTITCTDGNSLTLETLADGTAIFYPGLDRLGEVVRLSVPGGARRQIDIGDRTGAQRHNVTLSRGAAPVRKFDLMVAIDTTGSMGDEIAYLKSELRTILADLARTHRGLDIRLGLVAYRDLGDEYVTRTYQFTRDLDLMQGHLRAQYANGGGDYPEAMDMALARAMAQQWRPDAVKSLLLVADAPPHDENIGRTWAAAEVARDKRIQIVPVAASGVGDTAEYVMRAMAAATQSRYIFITDDSGIGNPHAPPAVACYVVTHLDRLVRRVLDGQISGRRIEPREGEIIRSVGRYDDGKCILPPDFRQQQ